jgi:hypothetical protein
MSYRISAFEPFLVQSLLEMQFNIRLNHLMLKRIGFTLFDNNLSVFQPLNLVQSLLEMLSLYLCNPLRYKSG